MKNHMKDRFGVSKIIYYLLHCIRYNLNHKRIICNIKLIIPRKKTIYNVKYMSYFYFTKDQNSQIISFYFKVIYLRAQIIYLFSSFVIFLQKILLFVIYNIVKIYCYNFLSFVNNASLALCKSKKFFTSLIFVFFFIRYSKIISTLEINILQNT